VRAARHHSSSHGLSTPTGDDWRTRSACRDVDPELFFPVGTAGPALLQVEQAKAVCRRCPVIDRCLIWALKNRIEHGGWGGTSEDERRTGARRAVPHRQVP
jgi:WhiB family redox-sensing transcriptional regulator